VEGSIVNNWIMGLGGEVVDGDSYQAQLDSPEAIAALSVLADTLSDGCGRCASELEQREAFSSGKLLFTFGSTADLSGYVERIRERDPDLLWNVSPVPHRTSEPVVSVSGSVLAMLRTSPRQQVASWLFMRFLLEPGSDALWAMGTGAMPMLRSTKYLPSMQAYVDARPQYSTALELLTYARPEPSVVGWDEIRQLLGSAVVAICSGQSGPAEILASVDTAADLLLP
jgi:multiple sugar transport system substrate-binding protein